MFKFAPKDRYKTKLEVLIPGDFGKLEKTSFTVEFRRLDVPQTRALFARLTDAARTTEIDSDVDLDGEILRENLLGWDGVPSDDGGTVPFSEEALDEMLRIPCYRRALVTKFLEDLRNPGEVARKN